MPARGGIVTGLTHEWTKRIANTSREDDNDWPDRTELSLPTDLDKDRLIAAFEMIRSYVRADLPDFDATTVLQAEFIRNYRHVFRFDDYDPFGHYDENGYLYRPTA